MWLIKRRKKEEEKKKKRGSERTSRRGACALARQCGRVRRGREKRGTRWRQEASRDSQQRPAKPAAASRLFDEKATASSMRPIRGNPGGKRDWDAWTLTLPEIRMRVACPVSWCCPLSLSVAHNVRDVSDTFRSVKASRMERSSAFSVSSCISHTEYIETVRLWKSWTWNFHVSIVPFFEQFNSK